MSIRVVPISVGHEGSSKFWEERSIPSISYALSAIMGGIASSCYCLGRKRLKNLNIINLAFYVFTITPPLIPLLTVALSVSVISQRLFGLRFQKLIERLPALLLVTITMNAGISIFIHECGHAVLASLLFREACPTIHILPFQGGVTTYTISCGLTVIGESIGQNVAEAVITAGGFIASCLFAKAVCTLPSKISLTTKIQRLLKDVALNQLFFETVYALKACVISRNRMENDFTKLWITKGIHPLVPIAVTLLMLVQVILLKPAQSISEAPLQQQSLSELPGQR